MKEIGGYFELERFYGKEFYSDTEVYALNNGRSALLYLLLARNIKKLYIPFYLCDSVSNLCSKHGIDYEYYAIDSRFMPIFTRELQDNEFLYVVNFFGQIENEKLLILKKMYRNLIFDNVQAFFQRPIYGVDTIYSCRKFFGVPDGAYLATDAVLESVLAKDRSSDRMHHILGRFEGTASDYYADFKHNDYTFSELPLSLMSELTHNLLRAIDYETVIQKRNENFSFLHRALSEWNALSICMPNGPFCYPFYCENGMDIKSQLIKNKIYVPTLWPNVLNNINSPSLEKSFAANILPIPCDQRYDVEDMHRVLTELIVCLHK